MKIKIILMFFIMLMVMIISFSDNAHADDPSEINIKVSIVGGSVMIPGLGVQFRDQRDCLSDYVWSVSDKEDCNEYNFKTELYQESNYFIDKGLTDEFLNRENTDVLIIAGASVDMLRCSISEKFRKKYAKYIFQEGGFITECGGGSFPLPHHNPRTHLELRFISKNSFFPELYKLLQEDTEMNTKVYGKMGFPYLSQDIGVKYSEILKRYVRDIRHAPEACGIEAYNAYNLSKEFLGGVCFNLTDLNKEHPILKDFWGNSLFVRNGAGLSYDNLDPWVYSLAKYPKSYEKSDSQKVNVWSWAPARNAKKDFKKLVKLAFECKLIGEIEIADLPEEWQDLFEEGDKKTCLGELFILVGRTWRGWKKTSEYIETELPYKSAIIAFDYNDNPDYEGDEDIGRVVLSGPHIFADFWWDDGEIVNNPQEPHHSRKNPGLYHWEDKNGNEIDTESDGYFDSTTKEVTNNCWFFRRETAWASSLVDDDRHLPPVYGRSQVIDFDTDIKYSSEFTVHCCVGGKDNGDEWEDVSLTLYYKYMNDSNITEPIWTKYDTIDPTFPGPYYFDFDASKIGDGLYHFCSILKNKTSDGTYHTESFPPGYDAKVEVKGPILADFSCITKYPYANTSVFFNSNESSTKEGSHITTYEWDFGDSTQSSDPNPIHIFNDDGVYNVTLTVTNNLSYENTTTKTITVHNNYPEVFFEPEYKIVFVNETVNFTENSTDIDGYITKYYWDFDDGTNSTVKNINHSYSKSGYYSISLEITDDDNSTSKEYGEILVINMLVNQTKSQQGNIWNNIQDAVDNASTNDYIYVENGTYTENIVINKTIYLIGEDKNNVVLKGSIVMNNPYDYELPTKATFDYLIVNNMTGNVLLIKSNNDTSKGENYSSSNLVLDYSGENNNGTNNGAIWTTSTIKGAGAFVFDGIDDSINLTNISALIGENVTVSAWINCDDGNGIEHPIISQTNTTSGYCLFVNNSTMKPCFRLDNDIAISSKAIGTNEWHFIVGTHDETSLRVYVDGKLTGNISKNGAGFDTLGFIGFDNDSNYFDGRIDEVAVWNRTLTDEEINLIYESNNGIKIESITFKDSNIGITPCNHSQLSNCYFINHTVGILLNSSNNVMVQLCNVTDSDVGIDVSNSNPEVFYFNSIVDCSIDNVTSAINVSNSKNLYIVGTMVNGSTINLSFSNSDLENISVINSWSPDNVAPDDPDISGPDQGDINTSYTYYSYTNDSNKDLVSYYFDWGDGNNSGWIGLGTSGISNYYYDSHKWESQGGYYVKTKTRDIFDYESNWSTPILFRTENLPPLINSVNNTPDPVGFGFNVTITANVTDDTTGNYSDIKIVKVNVSYPDDTFVNVSMNDIGNDTYEYVFSDSWAVGQYNYSIWAIDNAYNTNASSGHSFNVSVDATISVCTINSSYTGNSTVNLTDPPGSSYLVGYEFLDDGEVLNIWNNLDHYYFNTSSGIQLTNHYDEYWSHNVLMLGYYNNDEWNLIYRTDELSGFNKEIESDNETFVNVTLWKDLTYQGYDFRLAIRYNLGVDDNELTVIPYIKNIGQDDIPYVLGFGWEMKDIQINMTTSGDYIDVNRTMYYLNQTLDNVYINLSEAEFYLMENITDINTKSLYLKWNQSL
jgi:hypothetical protein